MHFQIFTIIEEAAVCQESFDKFLLLFSLYITCYPFFSCEANIATLNNYKICFQIEIGKLGWQAHCDFYHGGTR